MANNKSSGNSFKVDTPLEHLGFGFMLMFVGGIFFWGIDGFSSSSFFEAFMVGYSFTYFIIAGPFVLYGFYSLFSAYGAFGGKQYTTNQTMIAPAHWIATVVLLEWEVFQAYIVAFIIALGALHLGKIGWKRIKQMRNKEN